jgi:hydroxylamine reductase (hybrid-cluster protein)
MKNTYNTNLDAPDAHFNNLCLFSDAQAETFGNPKITTVKMTPPPPKKARHNRMVGLYVNIVTYIKLSKIKTL